MVDESDAIYASFLGVTENHINVMLFQLGDEISIIGRVSNHIGDFALGRCNINLFLSPLKSPVNSGATRKFAEARSLERRCDSLAVVVRGEIHKTVVLASVHFAVGRLALHIIQ